MPEAHTFSPAVRRAIESGVINHTSENYTREKGNLTNVYPSSEQYTFACKMRMEKYPKLRDTLRGTNGYVSKMCE